MWRACNNAIPSLVNLFTRKVLSDPCCHFCGEEPETSDHALLWCPATDEVWYKTVFWELLVSLKGLSFWDLLSWLAVNVKQSELEFACMILWGVWFNRNARSHAQIPRSADEVVGWVSGLLVEFHSSQQIFILKNKAPMISPHVAWSLPPSGELKLNSDVSVRKGFNHIGVGVVIRNAYGQVVVAMSKAILGDSFQWSDTGPIVFDIKGLFEEVGVVKCLFTPRNGNVMAYTLAVLAFSSMEYRVWLDSMPNCLGSLV
ncbi:hypothetical protein QYF36_009287 [Acer negundo]|nr:hypothetical protein QYF36_009287 [Acer negundo]